jgi:hypothetical protein
MQIPLNADGNDPNGLDIIKKSPVLQSQQVAASQITHYRSGSYQ